MHDCRPLYDPGHNVPLIPDGARATALQRNLVGPDKAFDHIDRALGCTVGVTVALRALLQHQIARPHPFDFSEQR
eukprot:4246399-Lingulodinium_polyedra.AAC.1